MPSGEAHFSHKWGSFHRWGAILPSLGITVKMRISAVSKCKEELNGAEENNNWKKKKQTRKNQQLIRWYEGMDQESGIQSSVII